MHIYISDIREREREREREWWCRVQPVIGRKQTRCPDQGPIGSRSRQQGLCARSMKHGHGCRRPPAVAGRQREAGERRLFASGAMAASRVHDGCPSQFRSLAVVEIYGFHSCQFPVQIGRVVRYSVCGLLTHVPPRASLFSTDCNFADVICILSRSLLLSAYHCTGTH